MTSAKTYCEGLNPAGYLVTITSSQEMDFIKSKFNLGSNSFWMAGMGDENGTWVYDHGPENGQLMFDQHSDRTYAFQDWCPGEPNIGNSEYYIKYIGGSVPKRCYNNEDGSKPLPLICEFNNGYDMSLSPASQYGGQSVMNTGKLPFNFDFNKVSITMKKTTGTPVPDFQCANPVNNVNTLTCNMPPGESGNYVGTITDGKITSTFFYQYMPPHVAVVYPSATMAKGTTITLTGSGFGTPGSATVNVSMGTLDQVSCSTLTVLSPGSLTCVLSDTVSQGLFPIKVTVNGQTGSNLKSLIYMSGEQAFYNCFKYKLGLFDINKIITNQSVEGMRGNVGVIQNRQTAILLRALCTWYAPDSNYEPIKDLYMNAVYDDIDNTWSYVYGPNGGTKVAPYPATGIGLFSSTSLQYDISGSPIDDQSAVWKYPVANNLPGSGLGIFLKNTALLGLKSSFSATLPTSGGVIRIMVVNPPTSLSQVNLVLKNGGTTVSTTPSYYVDYDNSAIAFVVPSGIGGPYAGNIFTDGVVMTNGSISITYQKPVITGATSPTTNGAGLTITGTNFAETATNMRIRLDLTVNSTASCANVRMVKSFTAVTCDAPESYGNGNVTLEYTTVTDKSNVFGFTFQAPQITAITPTGAAGGQVTVQGVSLYNNASLSKVSVDSFQCNNVQFIQPNFNFTCDMQPGTGTFPVKYVINNQFSNQLASAATFTYMAPVVTNSTRVKYLIGGDVTVTGSNFGNVGLTVTILSTPCTNISFVSNNTIVCRYPGTVDASLFPGGAIVNVTVNGLSGNAPVFFYDFPECDADCSGHGQCNEGACKCDKGWELYKNCSAEGGSGGKPTDGGNGNGQYPGGDKGFTSAITHLREISSVTSEPIPGKIVALKDATWVKVTKDGDATSTYNGTFTNSPAVVVINVTAYDEDTTIQFAGQSISISANSLKFIVSVYNWKFDSVLNAFHVIFASTAPKTTVSQCKTVDTVYQSGFNQFQLVAGDSVLQTHFANGLIVEDRVMVSNVLALKDSDPLMIESNQNQTTNYTQMVAIVAPSFEKRLIVDPSFRSLISSQTTSECSTESNWRLIVIVVICSVVGVGLIVASILLIRRKLETRRMQRNIQMKQQSYMESNS
ncbi:hypothetical protein SAMD00019534_075120 [Acytostelium subglobosum LB1]|uniref:hypothetical protein n=1 Tax=Acytostelium subglobosum LB1 TaxID=1410327 RepID=UPI00064520D5|nr:hypothetical protein SAMD00019534_075120 [Acytostelium subglobosum LB1]GAM24337.1 hypothetical protein SAMD00019534_075120 [Acytostelium subglobosum LB1]|eukprot:XP_012752663.1 hypothetical protein SAMD00019534_075120 [Acytostelium subglobosum LB1]